MTIMNKDKFILYKYDKSRWPQNVQGRPVVCRVANPALQHIQTPIKLKKDKSKHFLDSKNQSNKRKASQDFFVLVK